MITFDIERLRPFVPDDLPAVLAFAGECNARTGGCGYLHPGDIAHTMSNGLRGRDLDRHIALYTGPDGELAAVAIVFPAREAGYDLLVHPDVRGGDLERGLLAWSERTAHELMREAGVPLAPVTIAVMDCDTVRRELLLAQGYEVRGPSLVYTTRSLDEPIPDAALPEGFSIRSVAGEHEVEAVAAVHDGSFRPKWAGGHYLPVMRTPGYESDRELVVVAPDGRFAAFLVYWLDPISRSGLFEPVGCHAEFRRRGLTKALMYEGMRRMVARGMRTAIVNHIPDNPPAAALYHAAGFRTKYVITDFRKPATG